ncbi:MAG: hypothetical protein P8J33_10780, partial [Pirellulaceae bacterium]|nr:hypothetical protein [Pirellulaceae bacterium]
SWIIAFHLFCVALAPLAAVDPRPVLAVDMQRALRPYSESLYLLHGYRFFAPEPGPSHIVRYQIALPSGELLDGQFPDRDEFWPRLIYHRWFMLSETVFQHVSATLGEEELGQWQQQVESEIEALQQTDPRAAGRLSAELKRELQDHERALAIRNDLVINIGKTLLQRYGGEKIEMRLVTRVIPPPQDIAMGLRLDNDRYLPAELSYNLGTVYANTNDLESLAPEGENAAESSLKAGQGRGDNTP